MENVTVGIFWVIHGEVYYRKQERCLETAKESSRTKLTGIVDSDFGHFDEWDGLCGRLYPRADFATYPRGRLVYRIEDGSYILYADECIKDGEIIKIASIFGVEGYRVCRDEHYSCDKCIRKKGLF